MQYRNTSIFAMEDHDIYVFLAGNETLPKSAVFAIFLEIILIFTIFLELMFIAKCLI